MVKIAVAQEDVQIVGDVVLMVVVMIGLSGGAATGGGGSCNFEKDGLSPVVTAAIAFPTTTSAAVLASVLSDCFHFTYFNAQIGQPIVITPGVATPADVPYYTADCHQLPQTVIPGTKIPFQ
jgi:hypothetical protein